MYQNNYYLKPKPIQLLNSCDRLRKRAELKNLSEKAKLRLEWIIFYKTAGNNNATYTARYFGIPRSKFYFWHCRFNELDLTTLEDKSSTPRTKRAWNPDPDTLARMIKLRKEHPHWSKLKLAVLYERIYGEKISSWQFQRVICEFKLYPKKKRKNKKRKNKAKKQIISYEIRRNAKNLYCLDTKVLWLFGVKYYILVAIAHTEKVAYARAYTSHSSKAAADFLDRLEYLLGNKIEIILTDNGSEFEKYFSKACITKNINRYFSKVKTPKDNPVAERLIKTLVEEHLNDGNFSLNLDELNRLITDWLIVYNDVRPHQSLNYLTPLQCAEKTGLLSKRSSSRTHC
jgi:transposase InsO family protein